jgi:hypothetical protein
MHQAVINYVHLVYCKLMCLMQTNTEGTISATTFGNTIPVLDLGCHSVAEDSSLLICGTMSGVLAHRVPRRSESSHFSAQYSPVTSTGNKPSVTTMSLVMFPLNKML